MTRDQIITLLQAAQVHDNRDIAEPNIAAWAACAEIAGWAFDEAIAAIHTHYAHSKQWIMPGHITERIQSRRTAPPPWWQAD